MKPRTALSTALLGCLAASSASAHGIEAEPSASAARCVVMSKEPLAYPRQMAERKTGGVLRVKLTFQTPTSAPRAEVFYDTVGGVFREAVLERVDGYRLPCLRSGEVPLVMTQEFLFSPDEGRAIVWRPLRDERALASRVTACITGADQPPNYPHSRINPNVNGTVFARYTFNASDAAPAVEILFDGGSTRFADVVRRYAANLRLPCLSAIGIPLTTFQSVRFVMEGARQTLLRDMPLATFVRALDKLEAEHVKFDFATMACPFDVRFVLRQPVLPNEVGEIERSDPNRREFIEWLKTVSLKIPERDRAQVLGDSMTLSVPCGVLDLS